MGEAFVTALLDLAEATREDGGELYRVTVDRATFSRLVADLEAAHRVEIPPRMSPRYVLLRPFGAEILVEPSDGPVEPPELPDPHLIEMPAQEDEP